MLNSPNIKIMRNPKFYTKEILKIVLPKYCNGRTVDIGSGHAKYKDLIKNYCKEYIAVDNLSSEYQFKDSNENYKPDVMSDVLNTPFNIGEFDTAICTEVLEHVENPFLLFKELSRILKRGGHLILSSGWATPYHKEPKDYWRFSKDAYDILCNENGFKIVEIHKKGGLFSCLFYFIDRNIDLNSKYVKRIKSLLSPLFKILEILAEKSDFLIKTEDTIGHLIIAKKI